MEVELLLTRLEAADVRRVLVGRRAALLGHTDPMSLAEADRLGRVVDQIDAQL